ncbi:hypothetical protein F4780DRAFT_743754 [Xylariomycetidae sp. FL0641]|nr:hypothetical protein F4780DRAFT_743754 [Xylariomycetidae sp. FL0641]
MSSSSDFADSKRQGRALSPASRISKAIADYDAGISNHRPGISLCGEKPWTWEDVGPPQLHRPVYNPYPSGKVPDSVTNRGSSRTYDDDEPIITNTRSLGAKPKSSAIKSKGVTTASRPVNKKSGASDRSRIIIDLTKSEKETVNLTDIPSIPAATLKRQASEDPDEEQRGRKKRRSLSPIPSRSLSPLPSASEIKRARDEDRLLPANYYRTLSPESRFNFFRGGA